jgi:D-alanyl-D-alanine carboxypeptidase
VALLGCVVALSTAAAAAQSKADSKYAALVIDRNTGKVLYSRQADAYRYPASLTKMMTLYLLFEELDAKRMKLTTRITISQRASLQPPSKLGLKPGESLSIEDAILALVTKSANDVAVAVAEAIAGTEYRFARSMTKKAHSLGMSRTSYFNASGLPDERQKTTARDIAVLSERLITDFPQYYKYFSRETFTWRGHVYNNHNSLLGRYEGVTGIKTGYIRDSGFNLAAAVQRDGQNILAVVMGGKTSAARDTHMEELLDIAYNQLTGQEPDIRIASLAEPEEEASEDRPTLVAAAVPVPKPAPLRATAPASASAMPEKKPVFIAIVEVPEQPKRTMTSTRAGAKALRPKPASLRPSLAGADPAATRLPTSENGALARLANWMISPAEAAQIVPNGAHSSESSATTSGWAVQIGAFSRQADAAASLETARKHLSSSLTAGWSATMPVTSEEKTLYRARLGGFAEKDAQAACKLLGKKGIACLPVPPEGWMKLSQSGFRGPQFLN